MPDAPTDDTPDGIVRTVTLTAALPRVWRALTEAVARAGHCRPSEADLAG